MKLSNLFDIVYCDKETQDDLEDIINSVEIQNFLNLNDTMLNQFTLIVSKNIIYNKMYNKVNIELHNSQLTDDTITNILKNIQTIMKDNDNGDSVSLKSDDNNSEVSYYKNEYIHMHLFLKNYLNDSVRYLSSFFFNDKKEIEDKFDIRKDDLGKFDSENELAEYTCLNHYYTNYYREFNDIDIIEDYLDKFDILDNYLINNLDKIMTGFYLNLFDIKFQMILRLLITTYFANFGRYFNKFSYKDFLKSNSLTNYFSLDSSESDLFEKSFIKNISIQCDHCQTLITYNCEDLYYHHNIGGDICSKCYDIKVNEFKDRILNIKNRILRIGRVELFKKEVIKTRDFLKKKKFKCKKKNYYLMLEKMNKNLVNLNNDNKKICKICYSELIDNIYVGSHCGHCFHKDCIDSAPDNICQICRKETPFIKLFL